MMISEHMVHEVTRLEPRRVYVAGARHRIVNASWLEKFAVILAASQPSLECFETVLLLLVQPSLDCAFDHTSIWLAVARGK